MQEHLLLHDFVYIKLWKTQSNPVTGDRWSPWISGGGSTGEDAQNCKGRPGKPGGPAPVHCLDRGDGFTRVHICPH